MHEHTQCKHEIKYCKVCDVAYCNKCNKQWFNYTISYTPYTWLVDANPYTVTITNHVHE